MIKLLFIIASLRGKQEEVALYKEKQHINTFVGHSV